MTALTRNDAAVVMAEEGMEIRNQEIGGGMYVSYLRIPSGTDLRPMLEGLPEDLCQCPHWGLVTKGKLRLRTKRGEEMYEAGQAFYWAPGHAPEALEDTELTQISPMKELDETLEQMAS